MKKLLFLVNVDWFFLSHRLPIAQAALAVGYQVHIATGITDKKQILESFGFVVHELPVIRGKTSILNEIKLFIKIVKVLRQEQPDILHTITIKPALFGGIAARIAKTKRLVIAISGLGYVFTAQASLKATLRRRLVSAIYKQALQHKKLKVIFQNTDDQQTLTKATGIQKQQTLIIPGSGVDLMKFQALLEPSDENITVVMASRLLADKGTNEFIAAARQLHHKGIKANFQLAGTIDPDNPASITTAQVADWRNEGIVTLLDHRSDIATLFAQSHIVVLPSYREGFPKVLIEAAACGRAVVTTDVPGCRDAIIPNKTGLLAPARNANALAAAIERLIHDKALRQNMGKAGRQLAEEKYDINQVVQTHLNIYAELVNQPQ
jgi:glycosyltransferase involved in cell wall biosynthesis